MDELIRKKNRQKTAIDRIQGFVVSITDPRNININELVIREGMLIKAFESYTKVQDEIEDLLTLADKDKLLEENVDRDNTEKMYISCHSKIRTLIQSSHNRSVFGNNGPRDSSFQGEPALSSKPPAVKVNLPNLNVPIFKGNYGDWRTFIDIFSASIDNDDRLADSQKFMYLKSFLRDEALSLVSELCITDDNYIKALDILRSHYDRKLPVINHHITSLLNVSLQKGPTGLRDFTNQIRQHINALEALEVSVMDNWDLILINILSSKLDRFLRNDFELGREQNMLPNLKQFFEFLDKRIQAWESSSSNSTINNHSRAKNEQGIRERNRLGLSQNSSVLHSSISNTTSQQISCTFCKGKGHNIYKCFKFMPLTVSEKREFVSKNRLCFNCLGSKHSVNQCDRTKCKTCGGKHHTCLHEERSSSMRKLHPIGNETSQSSTVNSSQSNSLACTSISESQVSDCQPSTAQGNAQCLTSAGKVNVLLATARVKLMINGQKSVEVRALLDSASQTSFVTSEALARLNVMPSKADLQISGISQSICHISQKVDLVIGSNCSESKQFEITCGVLNKITCALPQAYINIFDLNIPPNIQLADDTFNIPGKIDLLIGADMYFDIIEPGFISLGSGLPVLLNTKFGWVLGGKIHNTEHHNISNLSVSLFSQGYDNALNEILPKFWQLEEISVKRVLSQEDKICETIFSNTTQRDKDGRFVVDLPLKADLDSINLGDSFDSAKRRFLSLERRLTHNTTLSHQYKTFIHEYISLGHAEYVSLEPEQKLTHNRYFLPHHCVIKEESVSTKLRVVFDASMQTTSGNSLNDMMFKGPTVQPDLFDIVCRFRTFKYVLTSDIVKMYRQVQINVKHRHLQNILWRDNPNDDIKWIQLKTVTYGTNCAPFLATRCLVQLGLEGALDYPLASRAILEQCYVDDILSGSDSLEGLKKLHSELIQLLQTAGFQLHKWVSNVPGFPDCSDNVASPEIKIHITESLTKVLGLSWQPLSDNFGINGFPLDEAKAPTKRNILSHIARLFDPLGFIGPLIIIGKIIMQKLWKSKAGWDDIISEELQSEWIKFSKDIPILKTLKIPRLLFCPSKVISSFELHGFSDASLKAYGTCFYIRALYTDDTVTCRLICSKSRVAPLKIISLPRLELCGCVLMARLCHQLCSIFQINLSKVVLWTDSKIVLSWLQSSPSRWTTFVCNRVAEIQELTTNAYWQHVSSENNPADFISRGLDPASLLLCFQWWNGPNFLCNFNLKLEATLMPADNLPEKRSKVCHVISETQSVFSRFSNFSRLQRTIAFCLRFVYNCLNPMQKLTGPLTVNELQKSLSVIVRCIQGQHFAREINNLNKGIPIKSGSLTQLSPFLDNNGILRITGRLANSNLPYSQKHPMILPSKDHVVGLLYRQKHLRLLHAGPQTILSNIRLKFWPINALRQIKNVVKNCITCHKLKAAAAHQLMGSLPSERTSVSRPFSKVGIDFGGPIMIKESFLRKAHTYKAYIALFICMTTKAIHLELVSSLSTESFVSTLKRFIARRGCPEVIFSDNATNFQGANHTLKELYLFFKENKPKVVEYLASREIVWKFIPPNSPHWGGLWEAGIKSTKFHLRRTAGNRTLTFEQMSTLLCQIEAILNSRPISPISSDPNDISYLTPNHFLIGEIMRDIPEHDIINIPDNRLKIWQYCQKQKQIFWKRWSSDFLNRLQHRPKWSKHCQNLKIGELVVLKEDNAPPLSWNLARIIELKPGKDGKVRLVKLRCKNGEYYRSITKLCPLPFSSNGSDLSTGGEDVGA